MGGLDGVQVAAIRALPAAEALARRDEIAEIWPEASRDRLDEILPRHAARAGFRFFTAEERRRMLGFSYGYLGAPGQWWHDLVSATMTDEQRRHWLAPGHFEFVELHVRPEFRRRGIGGTLHDALLEGLESRTAVLSTQVDNDAALALYRGRDWQIVVPELRFAAGGTPYSILGLDLTAGSEE
jgi:ribosomal protein S18 acetylase RimI-like enzyme